MIKLLVGFVLGAGMVLALVFLGVLTPGTVRTVAENPQQGVSQVADNMVKQVKEGARNLRTNSEAAAMVKGKTSQDAVCRREGLSTRHVCRTRDAKIYRVMGDDIVLFKGDIKTLDADLSAWTQQAFEATLTGAGAAAAAGATPGGAAVGGAAVGGAAAGSPIP